MSIQGEALPRNKARPKAREDSTGKMTFGTRGMSLRHNNKMHGVEFQPAASWVLFLAWYFIMRHLPANPDTEFSFDRKGGNLCRSRAGCRTLVFRCSPSKLASSAKAADKSREIVADQPGG